MSGPWYGRDSQRLRFERGAAKHFPTLRTRTTRNGSEAGRHYNVELVVPNYENRRVHVLFRKANPRAPKVRADGPANSPHRFGDGCLCIWWPRDTPEMCWVLEDGLVRLLGLIVAHLIREAWWRETGEWLGPEAPHQPDASKAAA